MFFSTRRRSLCYIYEYKIDDSGKVLNYKINEAVINNRKRMTYTEVNKYLEENTIPNGYENYTELLDNLYKTAMKVKRK